jgi:hypothetical protein
MEYLQTHKTCDECGKLVTNILTHATCQCTAMTKRLLNSRPLRRSIYAASLVGNISAVRAGR